MQKKFIFIILFQILTSPNIKTNVHELVNHDTETYWKQIITPSQSITKDSVETNLIQKIPLALQLNLSPLINNKTVISSLILNNQNSLNDLEKNQAINNIKTLNSIFINTISKTQTEKISLNSIFFTIFTKMMKEISPLLNKENLPEAIKINYFPNFFFCLGLFENILSNVVDQNINKDEFHEKIAFFHEIIKNFFTSELNNKPEDTKYYHSYFINHITFGIKYFSEYIKNNEKIIKNLNTFNYRINALTQIFFDYQNNFEELDNWFLEKNLEELKKNKQKRYKNIEFGDIENTINIPTLDNNFVNITYDSINQRYDPSAYNYVNYIANEQSDLSNIDPEELNNYGIEITLQEHENDKENQIKIDNINAKYLNYDHLVNENNQEKPIFSINVFVFKEIIKYYYKNFIQKIPSIIIIIKDTTFIKELQSLSKKIIVLIQIDLLFNRYTTNDQKEALYDELIKYIQKNPNEVTEIKEYARNMIKATSTSTGFNDYEALKKRINEINEKIPQLELLGETESAQKAPPKKSYFYQKFFGSLSLIAIIFGILHKQKIITVPFFNKIPYLRR